MKLFNFGSKESRRLSKENAELRAKYNQAVDDRGWTRIFDWTAGAWQTHHPYQDDESVLTNPTVFACQTLISNDIAKLPLGIQRRERKVWTDEANHPLSGLLRRPNPYQTRQQFVEYWVLSKLSSGNAYALKIRQGVKVVALHVLDPYKVTPLVSESGEVFYRIDEDQLTPFEEGQKVVPSTEIIHDRFNCLYHPLVGTSPIFAAGVTALAGLSGINNMKSFLANGSNPSGILTAPGSITEATATRLKEYWEGKFTGANTGKIAVAGDGLSFNQLRMSNVDAQLIETLRWDDEKIASVYHVPGYMVGIGATPAYNNVEALARSYYSQCLQTLIEGLESVLDIGLDVPTDRRVQVGIKALFRMDTKTQLESLEIGTRAGIISPDEARGDLDLPSVPGGKYPYMQQQNYSLEALSKRDAGDPFAPPPAPEPTPPPANDDTMTDDDAETALKLLDALVKNESR